jgi:lipopolysaccharide transport system ATP-binding protein
LLADARPAVSILGTTVIVDGEEALAVVERHSFAIEVQLEMVRSVPLADVGIKLTRADGVYVFWQSSGLVGSNLVNSSGIKTVRFQFVNHALGAGEYSVAVTVGNGWDFDTNYPYSELLARDLEACRFRVLPEIRGLDFGVVNQRVAVEIK